MSLKARLLVLIVLLVTAIVTVLSALHLNSLVQTWSTGVMERSQMVAQQVKSLVLARIQEKTEFASPPPRTLEETKNLWMKIVSEDRQLAGLILDTMSHARMIVEILVAGETGEVLVSSNPDRKGKVIRRLPAFSDWRSKEVTDRLLELTRGQRDYEVVLPLGLPKQQRLPIFTIQIVVSSAVLREALLPQVNALGIVSGVSLLLSILLGLFSANLAIGTITTISRQIDQIATGTPASTEESKDPIGKTRELAIVQSKLNMLGQQIRGAQEDATQMRSNVESLLDRMEDAVLLFDGNDRLIMISPAAERLLGAERQAMLGKALNQIFPSAEPLGSMIVQAVRLNKPARDYLVNLERDGKAAARLVLSVDPLADKSGILVTLRDVESRRQLASQIDVSQRLSAINRLTGGVAHEIKNPLNSIALRMELLRSTVSEDHPEADKEINIISQEIRRLDRVVKTFLDFTRPVDLAVEEVDMAALAREVTALVRPQAALLKVQIEFTAEPESLPIRGDRDLLKQAMLNVVMNGIEAMPHGGRLTVAARLTGAHCLVTIEDEGAGIPESNRAKVFQLYFTTKQKGSGIGLAMTFRAVQLHNGTIDFASETGRGTVFRLRFPVSQPAD